MISALIVALAATSAPLAPAGKWVVDYQDAQCIAWRSFGDAASSVKFAVKPSISPLGRPSLYLMTESRGNARSGQGTAEIILQPSGQKARGGYNNWVAKGAGGLRTFELTGMNDVRDSLSSATSLSISVGADTFVLQTGKLQPLLDALSTCSKDLLNSWGVDPANFETAGPDDAPKIFTDNDFPAAAMGVSARIVLVLPLDEYGRVTACRIVASSDNKALDETTCDLAKRRARYPQAPGKKYRWAILSSTWISGR